MVSCGLLVFFWKKKIKRIDPVTLRVADKEEPANQMRREGLKRLQCIIDGLVDVVRAQHGCYDGAVRWGGGGSTSQPLLGVYFPELDKPGEA